MAQNFKRRISLFPESFTKFQNSLEKLNEINLEEKADMDTFNKAIIDKNTKKIKDTPKKEKKVKLSLLDTPSIENKKYRKISIYSPISFGDMSTPVSKKNITEFNSQIFSEDEMDINNVINANSFFPCGKFKKTDYGNKKKNNKNIVLRDENNINYSFHLYYDKDIYEKNDTMKKGNAKINYNNIKNKEDNSDDEGVQKDHNLCVNEIGKTFDLINNNKNFFLGCINNSKKCFYLNKIKL